MSKNIKTFADYMADDSRVSPAEREKINFEVELIGKQIKVTQAMNESLLQYDELYKKLAE